MVATVFLGSIGNDIRVGILPVIVHCGKLGTCIETALGSTDIAIMNDIQSINRILIG
jgi:hypothetical protein